MQTPAGTRGAQSYLTFDLDSDIEVAEGYLNTSVSTVLPNRDLDFLITQASFNLRDQVRKGENFPLQFAYEAADCRIFYTPQTFYSYQSLWQYAVDAVYHNPSLCIQDKPFAPNDPTFTGFNSTEPPANNSSQTATYPITAPHVADHPKDSSSQDISNDADAAYRLNGAVSDITFLQPKLDRTCKVTSDCDRLQVCRETEFCVNGKAFVRKLCKQSCRDNASCGSSQRNLFCNKREKFCKNGKCSNAGFCESLISDGPDKKCAKLKTLPNPSQNQQADGIVVVLPNQPQDGEVDDAVGKEKGLTKGDYMRVGTTGAVVLAGLAPWD